MNELILKNFEIDYSFIIKNYLNPEMWKKTWNLLIYKSWLFKLNIYRIDTESEKINFKVALEDIHDRSKYISDWGHSGYEYRVIDFSLKIEDINFLKNKINSAMLNLIYDLEVQAIRATEEYKEVKNSREDEKYKLIQIAEEFLDNENVYNSDIRDVYIDYYVEQNSKINNYLDDIEYSKKYEVLTELYLIYGEIVNNKDLLKMIENKDTLKYQELMEEINEYIEYMETEEFENEMKENLEDL